MVWFCEREPVGLAALSPGAHGRREEQLYITSSASVERDHGLHMFQVAHLSVGSLARVSVYLQQNRPARWDLPVNMTSSLNWYRKCSGTGAPIGDGSQDTIHSLLFADD
jgi:hypothetical protein